MEVSTPRRLFFRGEEPPLFLDKMLDMGLWASRDVSNLLPAVVQPVS